MALTAGFVGSVLYSILVTRSGGFASLWLGSGFLAGALILLPRPWRAAVAGVCAAAHAAICLAAGDSLARALLSPAVNLLAAGAAAWLAVRFAGVKARRLTLRELTLLPVVAIAPAAFVAASAGAVVNLLLHGQPFLAGWLVWGVPQALGMSIVLPTVLLMARIGQYKDFDRSWLETAAELGALSALTALVFSQHDLPLDFAIFPALSLVAVRLGPPGAAVACLLVAMISLPLVMLGDGVLARTPGLDVVGRVRLTELIITAALFTTLATAATMAERNRLRRLMLGRDRAARAARTRAREAERLVAEAALALAPEAAELV
ncbi:MAG TPA: MASE1 domain-containing protein [Caulobacteraceae bacterium]